MILLTFLSIYSRILLCFLPIFLSFSPFIDPPSTQEQISFYKQTKTINCKTIVVMSRGFIEDSDSFSSKIIPSKIDGVWSSFIPFVN